MKKLFIIGALLLSAAPLSNALAQELNVAPAHLVCDYQVPEKLDTQVKSKLQRALTQYGISSNPGYSRFAMVPSVSINDEQTTTTIPVYCNVDFDLVISLQDAYSGKVFATYTRDVKGRGTNKSNAIAKGISALNLNNPDFSNFCEDAKGKVFAYYEANMGSIIQKAQNAAKMRSFDEALYILAEIPEECPSYASRVAPLVHQYYKQQMDLFGEQVLARARAAWAASPNAAGAAEVANILADMPPSCSSSAAAKSFVGQITSKVESLEAWERRFMEKELAYQHDERKAVIEASKAVAVAYARNQPKTITKVYLW